MFYQNERLAIFIDGPGLWSTIRALDIDIDYSRMFDFFKTKGRLLRGTYATTVVENDGSAHIYRLVDWLQFNGWSVITKRTSKFEDSNGRHRIRSNCRIELAMEMVKLAPSLDHIVLFSGDRDFCSVVAYLQERGIRVSVVSALDAQGYSASEELRRQTDTFIDLESLRDSISRN